MPIPESQLSRWADHGPQTAAKRTHEKIRNVLDNHVWPDGMTRDFSLQGSYSNDTNLPGDSDVDVVLELRSTVHIDVSGLDAWSQQTIMSQYEDATWSLDDFRREVVRALKGGFGSQAVSEGNKSIKVGRARRRLRADVVVCMGYRRYMNQYQCFDGIRFYAPRENRWIVNYPQLHYDKGAEKSRQTWDRFKGTVRMFKSARNHLVSNGRIRRDLAPSYFIECLVYNAPNWMFRTGFEDTYRDIVNWMTTNNLGGLMCQNGEVSLFRDSPEQWAFEDAQAFVGALASLWSNWE